MRLSFVLLAFSLPALAVPPCDGPEPKDVACRISHDASATTTVYQWREAGLPADVYCAERREQAAARVGRPPRPPFLWANPYQWAGRCFPALGETRTYRVRACNAFGCSGWSAPLDVIGTDVQCCTESGCAPC